MLRNKPTILIAESDSANCELLKEVLGVRYELLVAADGDRAVELAIAETPDLILLDTQLRGTDGFEVCTVLKEDRRTADVPVILMTAANQQGEEMRGLDVGAIDFISKPLVRAVVKTRVRNHLALKRQRDLLRGFSFLDGLTGLSNRRRFDQFLDQEWRRGQRSRSPLSLILMDVDYFKAFNDALGHLDGDDCLRQIAMSLEGCIHRAGDLIARHGGDEFACVLADTDAVGAAGVAENIQASIAALALSHPNSPAASLVTLSLGVVTRIAEYGEEPDSLIQGAERALSTAKESGRNRIAVWNAEAVGSRASVLSEE
jgi:diguanylate cyclase (GGDEF)-like protein